MDPKAEKPTTMKYVLVTAVMLGLIAMATYLFFNKPKTSETSNDPIQNTTMTTMPVTDPEPGTDTSDTQLAEGEELPADLAVYEDWEQVDGDGYYFMHPGYYIRDNGDHYIMAYEPRVGQEFSALVIYKPIEIAEPIQFMQLKLDEMDPSMGGDIVTEPQKVNIEGTKDAYMMAYEIKSGPTTGVNKIYLMQSPSTDKWIVVEYPENETAENIRKSINFID